MSQYQVGLLVLAVLTIIFNVGGFTWLARNHMAHAQGSLDSLDKRLRTVEEAVARIEGYCRAMHGLE